MTTPKQTWTRDDAKRLLEVCQTPNRIDASEFLAAVVRTAWDSGLWTNAVLQQHEVQAAFHKMMASAIDVAKGGGA